MFQCSVEKLILILGIKSHEGKCAVWKYIGREMQGEKPEGLSDQVIRTWVWG